jgi:general secretion pathway protein I
MWSPSSLSSSLFLPHFLRRTGVRFAGKSAGAFSGKQAGFTLIEVLVSLAVLAVCLSSIGALMAANIRAVGAIQEHLGLTETARAIWTALPDRSELQTGGNRSGETAGHRWRVNVQPYAARYVDPKSPSPWTPQTVIVRVQSPSGAVLQIDTVRLRKRADR